MTTAGLGNQVTTFTASDFGRTLTCNSDGTDHGWGSHHFVVGGAVQGQDMYGQYPVIGANQANDVGAGRLIPTTVGGPICRNACQLVWTLRWPGSAGLSELRQLRVEPVFRIYGIDASGQSISGSVSVREVRASAERYGLRLEGMGFG